MGIPLSTCDNRGQRLRHARSRLLRLDHGQSIRYLYIGVTNNLERRVAGHKVRKTPGFTARYNITRLVYYEDTNDVWAALQREKAL